MSRLIDPVDSVLVIIDVQEVFLDRVEEETKHGLIERITFLTLIVKFCAIPAMASSESPDDWGGLHRELVEPVGDASDVLELFDLHR